MISDELKGRPTVAALLEAHSAAITDAAEHHGEISLWVNAEAMFELARRLKQDLAFERLSAVTAVDWYPAEPRFEIVYLFHSLSRNERLRVKVRAGESDEVDSLTPLWAGANWYEREVFDLFGVRFRNHPNLTRIMMPDTWEGHPLRKDFTTHGDRYNYTSE